VTTSNRPADPRPTAPTLPPDPERYDSARDRRARAKGLPAPYIAGGDDPDLAARLVEERRLSRLLVAMVATIVGAGFIIGTILALVGPTS
jgi:hypothetical protein